MKLFFEECGVKVSKNCHKELKKSGIPRDFGGGSWIPNPRVAGSSPAGGADEGYKTFDK